MMLTIYSKRFLSIFKINKKMKVKPDFVTLNNRNNNNYDRADDRTDYRDGDNIEDSIEDNIDDKI